MCPTGRLPETPDTWPQGSRYEQAARIARLGHYVWDVIEDRCILCSEEHAAIHGMSVDDYVAQSSTTDGLAHPDDLEVVRGAFERLRGGDPFEVEFRIITPGGDTKFIREIGHPVFDGSGHVIQEIGTSQDITRHKELEATLRETEETLHSGIEALPLGFASFDAQGRLRFCNVEYARLIPKSRHLLKPGMDIAELVGFTAETVSVACGYDDPQAYIRDRLASTKTRDKVWTYRQGTGRWVTVSDHPTENGGFISIIQDISQQKTQEERLLQAQKMEAVGRLTGGVAHDFNNLLAIIQGNAELLKDADRELAPLAKDILRAVERGAELTHRLLAFSRRQRLSPQAFDLAELVSSFLNMLDRTLGEHIAIRFSAVPEIGTAFADRTQVESALLNLALNARDAMPSGGTLSIECYAADAPIEGDTQPRHVPGGEYVALAIKDTGSGMSEDQKARAFDPFYTTK
ncbi:MAG: PAS-domain containing protein, partial [Pseudomonadota bacterium]